MQNLHPRVIIGWRSNFSLCADFLLGRCLALAKTKFKVPLISRVKGHKGGEVVMANQPNPLHPIPLSVMPRTVAVSGIVFALLFIACVVVIRLAVPADPAELGNWLADSTQRNTVQGALNLVPFTGIAFLWFMGALRNRIGMHEDQFFATVFLGSGLLFVAMLFGSAATAGGLLTISPVEGSPSSQSEIYRTGRMAAYLLMNTYSLKMAAVFMFVTSTIGLRTAVLPRWLALIGFAIGIVLLLTISDFAWIALLFPLWVLLVSVYLLIEETRPVQTSSETKVLL